mmetsp:Transcript_16667/g.29632  ORF Transcript_16667/g.29632 Transcript_16667/m.29632 type:complete len:206 (-) Transcript_16667:1854-2471(-)
MLALPEPVDGLPLRGQLLVAPHLDHHLVLEGALQVLRLLGVQLRQALDVLLSLHLCIVLLFSQELVLGPLLIDLRSVFFLQLYHLFLVVAFTVPQLEFDLIRQLVHLSFQLDELALLVVQESPGDQDLVGWRQGILLVPLRHDLVLLLDIEHEQTAILATREEVVVVESDADTRRRRRVARKLVVVAIKRELVDADWSWCIWLRN